MFVVLDHAVVVVVDAEGFHGLRVDIGACEYFQRLRYHHSGYIHDDHAHVDLHDLDHTVVVDIVDLYHDVVVDIDHDHDIVDLYHDIVVVDHRDYDHDVVVAAAAAVVVAVVHDNVVAVDHDIVVVGLDDLDHTVVVVGAVTVELDHGLDIVAEGFHGLRIDIGACEYLQRLRYHHSDDLHLAVDDYVHVDPDDLDLDIVHIDVGDDYAVAVVADNDDDHVVVVLMTSMCSIDHSSKHVDNRSFINT
jgi:hypothetical protein